MRWERVRSLPHPRAVARALSLASYSLSPPYLSLPLCVPPSFLRPSLTPSLLPSNPLSNASAQRAGAEGGPHPYGSERMP